MGLWNDITPVCTSRHHCFHFIQAFESLFYLCLMDLISLTLWWSRVAAALLMTSLLEWDAIGLPSFIDRGLTGALDSSHRHNPPGFIIPLTDDKRKFASGILNSARLLDNDSIIYYDFVTNKPKKWRGNEVFTATMVKVGEVQRWWIRRSAMRRACWFELHPARQASRLTQGKASADLMILMRPDTDGTCSWPFGPLSALKQHSLYVFTSLRQFNEDISSISWLWGGGDERLDAAASTRALITAPCLPDACRAPLSALAF